MKIELSEMPGALRSRSLHDMLAFAIPGAILLLSLLIPPLYRPSFVICFWKNFFHIPCPGCGMTRAIILLGHGEISQAIRMNPASPLAFAIILFLFLDQGSRLFFGKGVKISLNLMEKIIVFIAAILIMSLVWIYNLRCNPWL